MRNTTYTVLSSIKGPLQIVVTIMLTVKVPQENGSTATILSLAISVSKVFSIGKPTCSSIRKEHQNPQNSSNLIPLKKQLNK